MERTRSDVVRTAGRLVLGAFLVVAGVAHLGPSRSEFLAQVPGWVPLEAELVVLVSGIVEILLGLAVLAPGQHRRVTGIVTAVFFLVILPGNISQYVDGHDAFGLDSDGARLARLFFQPLLIAWAWWSCGVGRLRPTA